MPENPDIHNGNMVLEQIFNQIKELRDDLKSNFVRKDVYEADQRLVKQNVSDLQDDKKASLPRWALIISIGSMIANTAITLLHSFHP
jgi:hypothetical protein